VWERLQNSWYTAAATGAPQRAGIEKDRLERGTLFPTEFQQRYRAATRATPFHVAGHPFATRQDVAVPQLRFEVRARLAASFCKRWKRKALAEARG